MKKTLTFILALCLCIGLYACGKQQNKLEGYYKNPLNGDSFLFEITKYGSGDYGGTVTQLDNTTNVSVWSIEGTTVYIDGYPNYTYCNGILLNEAIEEIVVGENNTLTGTYKCAFKGSWDNVITFNVDGTITYNRRAYYGKNYAIVEETGCYVVNENVVKVYKDTEQTSLIKSFYIANQKLYTDVLCPM